MGYFPVRYDPRVVIYERKMFIRLATEVRGSNLAIGKFLLVTLVVIKLNWKTNLFWLRFCSLECYLHKSEIK